MFELGKKLLVLSFIFLIGLVVAQYIVTRHLPNPDNVDSITRAELTAPSLGNTTQDVGLLKNQRGEVTSLSEIPAILEEVGLHKGKPLAIINADGFHFIDRNGNLLQAQNSPAKYDFPFISADNIKVDYNHLRISEESVLDALQLLTTIKSVSIVLYNQVSNIIVHDSLGIVIQLNGPPEINAIFGRGRFKHKVAYLATIMEKLAQSEILVQSNYLDFRYRGQVVVKKKA